MPAWLRRLLQESADEDILNQALLTACHEQDVRDSLPKLGHVLEGKSSRDAIRALIPSPSSGIRRGALAGFCGTGGQEGG